MLILTSWDDGHPLDLRIAELLAKYGLAGTFFVPITNREGRPTMTQAQLRQLDGRFEVGGHTLTHQYLRNLSPAESHGEIFGGKEALEGMLGHRVNGFCYPGGVFDNSVISEVKSAGYRYSRTIENLRSDIGMDPWRMPTTIQFYPHSTYVLARNLVKYPLISKVGFLRHRFREGDFTSFLTKMAESCLRNSQVFHLWGHSWEIDENNLWQPLDQVLRFLGGLGARAATLDQAIDCITDTASSDSHHKEEE